MPKGKPRNRTAGPALPSPSRLAESGESSAVLRLRLVGATASPARGLGLGVDGGHALEGGKGLDDFSGFLLGNPQII
jgi:hypothetical protein